MTKRNRSLKQLAPFAAGVLIGSSIVTPVFAASLDVEAAQPYVLLGALVILLIGLVLKASVVSKASGRNPPADASPDRIDLRRAPAPAMDFALSAHSH